MSLVTTNKPTRSNILIAHLHRAMLPILLQITLISVALTTSISTPPWMGLPPGIKFTGTRSYTWVVRSTVRVVWYPRTQARARIQTARSGVQRVNRCHSAPLLTNKMSPFQFTFHLSLFTIDVSLLHTSHVAL